MGMALELVRRVDQAINERRLDRLSDSMAADVEMISPRGVARGVEEVRAYLEAGLSQLPQLTVEPIRAVEDGASVAVQQRITTAGLAACELVCVDVADRRIRSWRAYYDQLPVLAAMGLAPPQPGGPVDHSAYPGPAGDPAPGADPAALGLRLIELLDAGHTGFDEVLAPDGVFVHPSGPFTGSTQFAALQAPFRAAFADQVHTVTRVTCAGACAVIEGVWAGTHTGPLGTPEREVPATGVRVKVPFAAMVRVVQDHIAAVHLHTDQVTFASQLGLLPAPA